MVDAPSATGMRKRRASDAADGVSSGAVSEVVPASPSPSSEAVSEVSVAAHSEAAKTKTKTKAKTKASADAEEAQKKREEDFKNGIRSPEDKRRERNETIRGFVVRALVLAGGLYYNANSSKEAPAAELAASSGAPGASVAPVTPAPSIFSSLMSSLMPVATGPVPDYYQYELRNAWPRGAACELRVFLDEEEELGVTEAREMVPAWEEGQLRFERDDGNTRAENVTVAVPDGVRRGNGSWWVHAFMAMPGVWEREGAEGDVLYAKGNLVSWVKRKKEEKALLGGEDEVEVEGKKEGVVVEGEEDDGEELRDQVYKPVVPLEMIYERTNVKLAQMPPNVAAVYQVNDAENMYLPPFLMNEFWVIRDQLQRMNESVAEVTLEMNFRTASLNWFTLKKSVEGMWETQMNMGTLRENEPDDIKRLFLETNPVLLGTTMVVSVLHSVLEAMAFKSDISHWKDIKNMEGVSVRSMMWNIVMQAIIFLYLFDNETSWMITIGNGMGIAIELWKLRKAVKIKSFGKRKLFGFIPWFELQHDASYASKTQEYDDEAMKYLSYIALPCVIVYALYSLKYEKHRSWYSWVIGSLVGAVYAFGFLMMLPQVIINYRLKSVAHMPMKAMAFKTVNTVIDDLFSFVIKMPTLHRLACFRDDAVFVVFLYQMYIYPVDKSRVNEFGQRCDDAGEAANKTEEKKVEKKSE